jgi:hypothetical protein
MAFEMYRMHEKIEYNKTAYQEGRCPNCGSENISEITGWCYNHGNPELNGGDLPFCKDDEDGHFGYISKITDAFMCDSCDTMFDEHTMANWNWQSTGFGNCPVGKEVVETPDNYYSELYYFINKYKESDVNNCMAQGHYLEAMGTLFIQISEQLRFLLIKRIKEHEAIPADPKDSRYVRVWKQIRSMKDYQVYDFALLLGRINQEEYRKLNKLRDARNDFSHSFEKRNKYSEDELRDTISEAQKVEQRLRQEVATRSLLPPVN